MKASKVMPTDGQFAAVWEYEGNVWADTFKWFGVALMKFSEKDGNFTETYSTSNFTNEIFFTNESQASDKPTEFIFNEVAPLLRYLKNPRKYREEYEKSTGYMPVDEHSWDAWLRGRIVSMLESIEETKVFDLSGDN